MMLYDSHTHTVNSDGCRTVDEMCRAAAELGAAGITVTDHADMNFYEERDHFNRIRRCISQVQEAKQKHAGKLEVLCGVELGEYLYDPENAKKILALPGYDAVLCSVHLVPNGRFDKPYNRIPFSREGTDQELAQYLKLYFDLLSDTVDSFDFDILAHISCPVRYMTGLYERKVDVMRFEPKIREILQKIIDRNIALEINTGGIDPQYHFCTVQNEEIFSLYRAMGGTLVTFGSDAHDVTELGRGFEGAKALLKKCGFTHYHYFKNRTPNQVKL